MGALDDGSNRQWSELYEKWLFCLMFCSSAFFVMLVTALSFTWVRQELKADREWERLHGKRPVKVEVTTTEAQDDRDGILVLREMRNHLMQTGKPYGRKHTLNCLPHISRRDAELLFKREGGCKDGSFVVSRACTDIRNPDRVLSVFSDGSVVQYAIRGAGTEPLRGNGPLTIEGSDRSFRDLNDVFDTLSKETAETDRTLCSPLKKNLWSDDAMDFLTSVSDGS